MILFLLLAVVGIIAALSYCARRINKLFDDDTMARLDSWGEWMRNHPGYGPTK